MMIKKINLMVLLGIKIEIFILIVLLIILNNFLKIKIFIFRMFRNRFLLIVIKIYKKIFFIKINILNQKFII